MAKKKNTNNGQVAKLTTALAQLNSKIQSQAAPKPKKRKQRAKRNKKNKSGRSITLHSDFAKAFLDPFSIKGARVPDSELVYSLVGCNRYLVNKGNPIFNFTSQTVYMNFILAPTYNDASKPMVAAGTTAHNVSWWNYTSTADNNLAPDLTKTWGEIPGGWITTVGEFPATLSSRRVSGGGIRLKFNDIPDTTPVDVYYTPVFNGDKSNRNYADAVTKAVAHYVVKNSGTVVVPFPIRNSANAFNWIDDTKDGTATTHFPPEAAVSGHHGQFVITNATDCTVTNSDIDAHSLSNGMGAISITMRLPVGAAVSVEGIIHIEGCISYGITNNPWFDEGACVSISDPVQMAAVANAASAISVQDNFVQNQNVTPFSRLAEFQQAMRGQAVSGMAQAAEDSQLMNRVAYGLTSGLLASTAMSVRRQMATV